MRYDGDIGADDQPEPEESLELGAAVAIITPEVKVSGVSPGENVRKDEKHKDRNE